jgi:uncharacterized membrane protein
MKTKSLPAVIMLVAGFIDCILAICYHLSLWEFTRQLLLVLVIFYLLGCVVKIVVDVNFKPAEENADSDGTDGQEETVDGSGEEAEAVQMQEEELFPEDLEDIQSGTE